jgi:hypothetical protein
LIEQSGNMIFDNFTIAESLKSGMNFYRTNTTKEYVKIINSIIIGMSISNSPANISMLSGSMGIIGTTSGHLWM